MENKAKIESQGEGGRRGGRGREVGGGRKGRREEEVIIKDLVGKRKGIDWWELKPNRKD